jgi:hypothetical protein
VCLFTFLGLSKGQCSLSEAQQPMLGALDRS